MNNNITTWQCGQFAFELSRPLIMGIVNITPDSFSDGGKYNNTKNAIAHGLALAEAGADIIDVGGESTRPAAAAVSEEDEKQRILPVIEALAAQNIAVSADTMKPAVMSAALQGGASILNDVCGFRHAESVAVAAANDCGVVIMHMQGTPQTMQESPQYTDVVSEVAAFLRNQAQTLQESSVAAGRICVDPGIGFGKTAEHNLQLLRNLPQLQMACGDYPLLIGLSRKSFFTAICGQKEAAERDLAGAAASALLATRGGANIFRVHDVAGTRDALAVVAAFN